MECLCECGRQATDDAHFPKHTGAGRKRREDDGLPRIPLCHQCHMALHVADRETTETVIAKAPDWWKSRGEWETAEPFFEVYMGRREYLAMMGGQR